MPILIRAATIDDALALAHVEVARWQIAYRDLLPHSYLQALSIHDKAAQWRTNLRKLEYVEQSASSLPCINTRLLVRTRWHHTGTSANRPYVSPVCVFSPLQAPDWYVADGVALQALCYERTI